METPDFTRAQFVAVVVAALAVATAFGAPITEAQAAAVIDLAEVLAAALVVGDAAIRHGRSRVAAEQARQAGTAPSGSGGHVGE